MSIWVRNYTYFGFDSLKLQTCYCKKKKQILNCNIKYFFYTIQKNIY